MLNCKLNARDSLSHWNQQLEGLPELQNLLLETGSERQSWSTEVAQVTRSRIHPKHHFLPVSQRQEPSPHPSVFKDVSTGATVPDSAQALPELPTERYRQEASR